MDFFVLESQVILLAFIVEAPILLDGQLQYSICEDLGHLSGGHHYLWFWRHHGLGFMQPKLEDILRVMQSKGM